MYPYAHCLEVGSNVVFLREQGVADEYRNAAVSTKSVVLIKPIDVKSAKRQGMKGEKMSFLKTDYKWFVARNY